MNMITMHRTSGTEDDDDARDDERARDNEAPIREGNDQTEAPEEFEGDDEDGLGHPEDGSRGGVWDSSRGIAWRRIQILRWRVRCQTHDSYHSSWPGQSRPRGITTNKRAYACSPVCLACTLAHRPTNPIVVRYEV